MDEEIVFEGKIGEVVHTTQPDGRIFEKYRRAPGVRLVIVSPENKILITQEMRQETGNIDYRLPGGKVCNSLKEYNNVDKTKLLELAREAAKKEAIEETGLEVKDLKLITVAKAGATVEWDLYYFIVYDFSENTDGQQLEDGEDIQVSWMTCKEIKNAIHDGKMQEWRSVGVLLGIVMPSLEK